MNWSAVKSLSILIAGVALGWSFRGLPQWSDGPGVMEDRPVAAAGAQRGAGAAYGGNPAGSANKTGLGKTSEKPTRDRVEMLVTRFRERRGEGIAEHISLILDIGQLSPDEIGAVMEELMAGTFTDWYILNSLTVRWGMLDPKAALDFAAGRERLAIHSDVMSSIVGELAKVDLPAAKAALARLGKDARMEADVAVVRMLIGKDVREALAYARELGSEEAEMTVLSYMAEKDPMAAAAELVPGKSGQLPVVEAVASALMTRSRAEFEEWMKNLKDPEQRAEALGTALDAKFQPDAKSAALEAADWLARDPEMSKNAGNLMERIAEQWMESKGPPAEVVAWAAGLPEGPARASAVLAAGQLWIDEDAMGASVWLRTLPPGESRDQVVLRLVLAICPETPADAFEWARTVDSSKSLRARSLMAAARRWVEADFPAAEKAVETLPARDQDYLWNVLAAAREEREKAAGPE